jgi:hypothetical protein
MDIEATSAISPMCNAWALLLLDGTDRALVLRGRHGHTQRLVGGGRRSWRAHDVLVVCRRPHLGAATRGR